MNFQFSCLPVRRVSLLLAPASVRTTGSLVLCLLALVPACGTSKEPAQVEVREGACEAAGATAPPSLSRIGCRADFDALSSEPLDATLPGARSMKVVLDRNDGNQLYFQNSKTYQIHYDFITAQLSGMGRPPVPPLAEFNRTQYYAPDRRFMLGAVTYYDGPKAWVLEMAPYDTASAQMLETLYDAVRQAAYFGPALAFHPTSQAIELEAKNFSSNVRVKSTEDLYADTDYQPLNLGEAVGQLRFVPADQLETTYVGFRDIVVLDRVPNDISVVAGLVTQEFQTPLSHVNVLAQNRRTPNMGLRGAVANPVLRGLDGRWVRLTVGASNWSAVEVTQEVADAFWEQKKPKPVTIPAANLEIKELRDIEKVTPVANEAKPTKAEIQVAVQAFGAKAANYSILSRMDEVPHRKAFAIPVFYYVQFMQQNGFYDRVDALLADPEFVGSAKTRDEKLRALRDAMAAAPVDGEFSAALKAKIAAEYPGLTMRFRTSTNAEDLDGFPCAGCYDSHTGNPVDWDGHLLRAVRKTWATAWNFRTFEERSYHSMDHKKVAMALLVHHNFPDEEANGVAVTSNPFDPSGLEPGLYVNVQWGGEAEVVAPPPGVTSDSFIYQFTFPGQPVIYLSHSNLVPPNTTVLNSQQIFALGTALDAIHQRFASAYGPPPGQTGWYAMDCEFKFDGQRGEPPTLFMKQARPYPGRGH